MAIVFGLMALMAQQWSLTRAVPVSAPVTQDIQIDGLAEVQVKAIKNGFEGYDHNKLINDDQLKLVLIRMSRQSDQESVEAAVFFGLRDFDPQRVASILRDMKIENPVDADLVDGLLHRIPSHHGGNLFEDTLKRIIAKVDEDPHQVAQAIIKIFLPLGNDAFMAVIRNLKELQEEVSKDSLQILIDDLEKALVNGIKTQHDQAQTFAAQTYSSNEGSIDVVAEEALDRLLELESDLKAVEEEFVNRILPVLIDTVKKIANKSSEKAGKVADVFVSLLRRLGSRALEAAIHFVDDHEHEIGERFHDFLLQRLQDALGEINFVREFGLQRFKHQINRQKQ